MVENRHIFNNLTQVEKIKPKIDNPIIVEDVTYNFSDLIENEWISHFPQYSHRMRSTFVKGAGIVDEHLANINQCLIQLEDELYRVYDKLSDDKKAEVTDFIQARQNEVNEFIQARKDEVASFISDRKTEVADFIKDRKNEVATFISNKQNLVDEFVQARQNEVAGFILSKANEVSNYINQKEEQITRFIENKDNEIKRRTETLDNYTKNLEGKIDQFNLVIQGGEATEDKLGLIRLSTISEQVQVATVENLKQALITPNFKDPTPVKWSVNITVKYCGKEKKIVADNLDKNKLDYVFNSSNYSEFANYHTQTETIKRADEEVKNVDKVIYLKLKQVTIRWHVTSEDGKINKTIEEVVTTQNSSFNYQFDPTKFTELAKYELAGGLDYVSIDGNNEKAEQNIHLRLRTEHPELHPSPEPEPPQPHLEPTPSPDPGNPSGGGMSSTDKLGEKLLDEFKNGIIKSVPLKYKDKKYSVGIVNRMNFSKKTHQGLSKGKKVEKINITSILKNKIEINREVVLPNMNEVNEKEVTVSKANEVKGETEKIKIKYASLGNELFIIKSFDLGYVSNSLLLVSELSKDIENPTDNIFEKFLAMEKPCPVNTITDFLKSLSNELKLDYDIALYKWFEELSKIVLGESMIDISIKEEIQHEFEELTFKVTQTDFLNEDNSLKCIDYEITGVMGTDFILPFCIYEEIKEPDTDDKDRP